jgi:hypothetical protein
MAKLRYPRWQRVPRFPRWRFAWWLLLYVEDSLARLPMLLLGPTMGAVIGTAVAVSRLSSVRIDGKAAAGVPSVADVLWPALLGGIGGVVALALLAAAWGFVSYLLLGGDDIWEARMNGTLVELVCKAAVPVGPDQLGAMECVMRRPSGAFDATGEVTPRPGDPYGVIATAIRGFDEGGTYRVRWYATEHKRRLHEVARMKTVV